MSDNVFELAGDYKTLLLVVCRKLGVTTQQLVNALVDEEVQNNDYALDFLTKLCAKIIE